MSEQNLVQLIEFWMTTSPTLEDFERIRRKLPLEVCTLLADLEFERLNCKDMTVAKLKIIAQFFDLPGRSACTRKEDIAKLIANSAKDTGKTLHLALDEDNDLLEALGNMSLRNREYKPIYERDLRYMNRPVCLKPGA
jgi:hypothetical protein